MTSAFVWHELKTSDLAAAKKFYAGVCGWNELVSTDTAAAKRFYGEVFGWGTQDSEVPGMGTYTLWKESGQDLGGMMKKPPQAQGPDAWIPYVLAENVDAWAGRVTKGGGRLWVPPTDIPNIGRFSVCADPQGATFALYRAHPM